MSLTSYRLRTCCAPLWEEFSKALGAIWFVLPWGKPESSPFFRVVLNYSLLTLMSPSMLKMYHALDENSQRRKNLWNICSCKYDLKTPKNFWPHIFLSFSPPFFTWTQRPSWMQWNCLSHSLLNTNFYEKYSVILKSPGKVATVGKVQIIKNEPLASKRFLAIGAGKTLPMPWFIAVSHSSLSDDLWKKIQG